MKPNSFTNIIRMALAAGLAIGLWEGARRMVGRLLAARRAEQDIAATVAVLPDPAPGDPDGPARYELDATNAGAMQGLDDPAHERWSDVAGNYYNNSFIRSFSYQRPTERGPRVWVRIEPRADTLRGRLEARGLKPNFAYQIKLAGDFEDRTAFERIGHQGRWRLPGRATNYTDWDYRLYPRKEEAEAYILFDFFVTDAHGDAVKPFTLDRTLHVLFNAHRQQQPVAALALRSVNVDASDPAVYACPKADATVETVWAEPEHIRYAAGYRQPVRLPPGDYRAHLRLTEESFHSADRDGGYWATVMSLPIRFTIESDPRARPPETN